MSNIPLENSEPKAPASKPLTFEERIAERIAQIVAARVVESISSKLGVAGNLRLHELPGCRLVGLRLSQFERFCEIMRESPAKRPYHAAQQVLKELAGPGGYKRASSLQRYAIMHKKYW